MRPQFFPIDKPEIKLAMLGYVEENGHPYSWSALFNGYDAEEMARCPYPTIPVYLEKNRHLPPIAGAQVTHIWTDNPAAAPLIARAANIPHILKRAEDAIGVVDAVLIPTDKGEEHAPRCRAFVEAGVPIFVDKPLCDNEKDLQTFARWVDEGAAIMSSSAMRYAKEFAFVRKSTDDLGELRFASITSPKSWERYGIHALEGVYPIFGTGFLSGRNTGDEKRNIVHLKHSCGADIVVATSDDMFGGLSVLSLCGTRGHAQAAFGDAYFAFKTQLESFVAYLRSGQRPFPFEETIELMKLVIAGIRSRDEGGREVFLEEIYER